MTNTVQLSYEPRSQFLPFHSRTQRWACMLAHRRAGKTVACINELIERASYVDSTKKNRQNPRYGYVAPFFSQAEEVAWQYLKDYAAPLIAGKPSESDLSVILKHNGAKIKLFGADNYEKLRGLYFDGVILDEYGDMKPSVWSKVLRPTLSDRRGWAVFIGTPKGKNHFYKIFRRSQGLDLLPGEDPEHARKIWYNFVLKASQSKILADDELLDARRGMTEDEYLQEYECSFDAALLGTYYAKLINMLEAKGQIHNQVQWDSDFPVSAAADLGRKDSTAFWFWQVRPDGYALIDYDENSGEYIDHYIEMLKNKGYRYDNIWLPHDAKAKTLATNRSTVEQMRDAEIPRWDPDHNPINIAPRLAIQHGIDAARLVLPSCWFAADKTDHGLEALRAYRRRYDEDKRVFADDPLHDWASDGSDAFRLFALVAKERILHVQPESAPRIVIETPRMKLDELWEERDKAQKRSSIIRI